MARPAIAILLPYAEHFCSARAGAIALGVRDLTLASRHHQRIRVYGRPVETPFAGIDFRPLEPAGRWLLGRNLGIAERLRREIGARRDVLVEIYNRPNMFRYLGSLAPRLPLVLRLGNDPQSMRGARTPRQRAAILARASAVICISDYLRCRFLDRLSGGEDKVHVLHNGIPRRLTSPPCKERRILFVGRIVPEKGVIELIEALERVLPRHPDWTAEIVGAGRFGADVPPTPYERAVRDRCAALGAGVSCPGFLPNDEVQRRFERAAIAVVPSTWPEPLSRTAIEGLAHGCAVVAADRGGLPELVRGRGVVVEPSVEALARAIESLITDTDRRARLQKRAWEDYPFDINNIAEHLDTMRDAILSRM